MIVAFAGRRAQSISGDLAHVALRVRRLLAALDPSAVVGALADGADLMVAEAALEMTDGPRIEVVLPTAEAVFRTASVADGWRARFDRVIEQARRRGTVRSLELVDGREAYARANAAILDRATELAAHHERAIVLTVASDGEGESVQDLVAGAKLRGIPSLGIDPQVDLAGRPSAFVAMPHGRRRDAQREIEVDCDLVYSKILLPALETAQLNHRRAGANISSPAVLAPMIEWLAGAEILIADLQTEEFNVGWELGVREALRSGQTLLMHPAGTVAPFDLDPARHVVYRNDSQGVSDDAAIDAWAALSPHLLSVGTDSEGTDSPIDALMRVARSGRTRAPRPSPRDS